MDGWDRKVIKNCHLQYELDVWRPRGLNFNIVDLKLMICKEISLMIVKDSSWLGKSGDHFADCLKFIVK